MVGRVGELLSLFSTKTVFIILCARPIIQILEISLKVSGIIYVIILFTSHRKGYRMS